MAQAKKKSDERPWLGVFVGDTHVMSDTGLCVPGYEIGSKEKRPYSASENQKWLYASFKDYEKRVKELAKGHRVFVGLGGDLVDGVQHHATTQTSGVHFDQVEMAASLLGPFVSMADACLGVTGTAAHVGDTGDDDRAVYYRLGVQCDYSFNLSIGGRRLWWSHHGLSIGSREWTLENSLIAFARNADLACARQNMPRPDAVFAHHAHRVCEPITFRNITVGITPCWQMPTNFGYRIGPFFATSIGGLIWHVAANRAELIQYAAPNRQRSIN